MDCINNEMIHRNNENNVSENNINENNINENNINENNINDNNINENNISENNINENNINENNINKNNRNKNNETANNINEKMDQYNNGPLNIVYGDVTLGVHGKEFSYIFSYQHGGLESLVFGGIEWLYRTPRPTFWRATTDNDRGNRFSIRAGMWLSADMFMTCKNIEVAVNGETITLPKAPVNNHFTGDETADFVEVVFTYETITVPSTTVEVTYKIISNGEMDVNVHYHGVKGLPELPVFGMRFIMPTKAIGYQYEGLSGETYPDRMAGGIPGVYQIEGLPVTKYLVPQDCNVHMNTKWLEVYRNTVKDNSYKGEKTFGLRFASNEKEFAFSCLPYTSEELENATHHEELPVARRTVVSILGAVRGVGGINSWGADVEPEYRIDAEQDICYSFKITKA